MTITEAQAEAAETGLERDHPQVGNRRERLRPMISRFDPTGSTGDVDFADPQGDRADREVRGLATSRSTARMATPGSRCWRSELELTHDVAAYVKNDHLGFTIPYVHKGRSHAYVPDFLVRLERAAGEDFDPNADRRGVWQPEEPRADQRQGDTARDSWCAAVNNHGGFGRWGYIEMTNPARVQEPPRRSDRRALRRRADHRRPRPARLR